MKKNIWIKGRGGYAKKILMEKIPGKIKSIQINKFPPRAHIPSHFHKKTTEIFYILKGNAKLKIGRKIHKTSPGQIIINPPGTIHELKNSAKEAQFLTFKINSPKKDTYWL